jgi:retron-type reverse transcriptase
MPKRFNNLYSSVSSFENIYLAFASASRGKKFSEEVALFCLKLEENLHSIYEDLMSQSFTPGKPRTFIVLDPKRREIVAPPFRDRVVHHALYNIASPIFDKKFIYHSYACRIGKGTQKAISSLQKEMKKHKYKDGYFIKADIRKYFASIDHDILLESIARTIKCNKTLKLWRVIMNGYGFHSVGRPVGALTSQLEANIFLNQLDHLLVEKYQLKYFRYMDDFIVLCDNKEKAKQSLEAIGSEILQLKLELNPKTKIGKIQDGVDWCGYRTFRTHTLPRKKNIKRGRSDLNKIISNFSTDNPDHWANLHNRFCNLKSYAKHCNAFNTINNIALDVERGINVHLRQ